MMRTALGVALLVASVGSVAAQTVPAGFPLDRGYKGISISGFDVQRAGITLTVTRNAKESRVVGSGSGGCNNWSATFIFRDGDAMDVAEVVTTRRACAKAKMTTEEAFLTTLKSAHRWRVDGNRLILEGEAGRLLLTGAAPAGKK
jgi:heat shock protein HslJ